MKLQFDIGEDVHVQLIRLQYLLTRQATDPRWDGAPGPAKVITRPDAALVALREGLARKLAELKDFELPEDAKVGF